MKTGIISKLTVCCVLLLAGTALARPPADQRSARRIRGLPHKLTRVAWVSGLLFLGPAAAGANRVQAPAGAAGKRLSSGPPWGMKRPRQPVQSQGRRPAKSRGLLDVPPPPAALGHDLWRGMSPRIKKLGRASKIYIKYAGEAATQAGLDYRTVGTLAIDGQQGYVPSGSLAPPPYALSGKLTPPERGPRPQRFALRRPLLPLRRSAPPSPRHPGNTP